MNREPQSVDQAAHLVDEAGRKGTGAAFTAPDDRV